MAETASATPAAWESKLALGMLGKTSLIRRLLRLKLAVFGVSIIAMVTLVALLAPVLAPYDPNAIETVGSVSPSRDHLLGTDSIGRDQLSRLMVGARASLQVSALAALFSVVVGCTMGLVAAYLRGLTDTLIMRFFDALIALPGLMLPMILVAALGGGIHTVSLAIGIGLTPLIARLMRGQALSQQERDYVLAARALGASPLRVMVLHVGRNSLAPIIVAASLGMSFAVIAEASLSFLGVGVAPPTSTWGTMLSTGLPFLRTEPWQVAGPGICIFMLVLAFNFLGDALRDTLDPRLRGIR